MKLTATAVLIGAGAANAASLRAKVEAQLGLKLGGPVNCGYKCGLMWNQRQDWNPANGFQLYEYAACLEGCELCDGGEAKGCMGKCKSTSWESYSYYFNDAKALVRINNDDIAKPLTSCLSTCIQTQYPTPGNGAGRDGKLPNSFTGCTQGCYNDHLEDVQTGSMTLCESGAQASCDPLDVTCYTKEQCFFGIQKGVVEPDKACIQGCSQNLCQDGAECLGKGYWLAGGSPLTTGCQLITPQTNGQRNTINPGYYGQQSDLGDCCNAALERCGYAPGTGSASFGVSLGRVIATDESGCKMPGSKATFGDIIQNSGQYECNCNKFLEECPGAMANFPVPFTCYGPGGAKTRTESVDGTVNIN